MCCKCSKHNPVEKHNINAKIPRKHSWWVNLHVLWKSVLQSKIKILESAFLPRLKAHTGFQVEDSTQINESKGLNVEIMKKKCPSLLVATLSWIQCLPVQENMSQICLETPLCSEPSSSIKGLFNIYLHFICLWSWSFFWIWGGFLGQLQVIAVKRTLFFHHNSNNTFCTTRWKQIGGKLSGFCIRKGK